MIAVERANVTISAELEALYEQREQTRRETVWLMSHAPHDGRPQARRHADGSPISGTVNAQEVRAADRWTPTRVDGNECRVSIDGGTTWTVFTPAQRERSSRTSRKTTTPTTFETDYAQRTAMLGAVGVGE